MTDPVDGLTARLARPGGAVVERLAPFGTTIFAEMSALATTHGAVNLGQGFPDTDGPAPVLDAARLAIASGINQYPPGRGTPELRSAVAEHQRRFWGIEVDPETEVVITAGATEAIAAAVGGLVEPGDEVVLFEPWYDSYAATVALAGGVRRPVTLRPPNYRFDPEDLRAAIGPRTRAVLVNTPHNPTGAVLADDQLALIAEVCVANDLAAISDEVYEHMTFDGIRHRPLATFDGMAERTVTISSASKTFSVTGWKVGWATGPAPLVGAVNAVKQFTTFTNGAPFQPAVAVGLGLSDEYFEDLAAGLAANRDRLCEGLTEAGFDVIVPQGTYFVTADIRPLGFEDGLELCRQLPGRCGVVAVPNQVFYDDPAEGRHLIRFAFCKRPEVIDEAARRLAGMAR